MANYLKPVPHKVTQGFGANAAWYRRMVGQKGHNGIDYGSPAGTPVKATADGVVAFEGWGRNHSWMGVPAGICALLKHAHGYSGYAHLRSTIVNKGQRVKRGQVIGYTGSTGYATGPHLHFETLPLRPNFSNGYAGRVNPSRYKLGVPNPPPTKTARAIHSLYVRKKPTTKSAVVGRRNKGDVVRYVKTVRGEMVEQNGVRTNLWVITPAGNAVWRGNLRT